MKGRILSSPYIRRDTAHNLFYVTRRKCILDTLDIELTERCNNNCIHCHICLRQDDIHAAHNELELPQIKEILREASSLGCRSINLTGGEPLLREDFDDIYIFARELKMSVCLLTNATLISDRIAKLFIRLPPLENIEVSVYGMKRDTYEAVTGRSETYEAAWKGINILLENKIPFIVKVPFIAPMIDEIKALEEWARHIPAMNRRVPSISMFFDLRSRRDSETRNKMIKRLRPSVEEFLKHHYQREEKLMDQIEFCVQRLRVEPRLFACGGGLRTGCIDPYGNFQLCILLKDPRTSFDVTRGSLRHALEEFAPIIREIKSENSQYNSKCAKCFLRTLCGQCPAKSWTENGTLDEPVGYLCDIAHAEAEFLGIIKGNEKAWEISDWKSRLVCLSERQFQNNHIKPISA